MYDAFDHGRMIADRRRGDAYAAAISSKVFPGAIVVDLGAGTGFHSLLACRAGARKVYAIESADIIEVARELAAANGCADRIVFIKGDSREIELPGRADVVVCDVRGVLPLFGVAIPVIIDARERFLTPAGTIIPERDELFAALVESGTAYEPHDLPWSLTVHGVDFSVARRFTVNATRKQVVSREQLLSPATSVARLEYASIDSPDVEKTLSFETSRDGTAHGLTMWFDSVLAPGATMTNAPGEPELIYGQLFLPFECPLTLRIRDRVTVDLAVRLVNNDDYLWRWNVAVNGAPRFRQSTFFAYPHRFGGMGE